MGSKRLWISLRFSPGHRSPQLPILGFMLLSLTAACARAGSAQPGRPELQVPNTCPVTFPAASSFRPGPPFPDAPSGGLMWFGTPALWTVVPEDGIWAALPKSENGFGQKLFYWSENYSQDENQPEFEVVGKKFDGDLTVSGLEASNGGHNELGSFIVTGIELPEAGCWEITGSYRGRSLSYTVWVEGSDAN